MIIDGHAHCAGVFYSAPSLRAKLDELGVDRVILCPSLRNDSRNVPLPFEKKQITTGSAVSFAGNRLLRLSGRILDASEGLSQRNDDVRSLSRKLPGRVVPFCWVEPRAEGMLDELDRRLGRDGFRGVKLHQPLSRFSCEGKAMDDLAALTAARSAPVFIHLHSPTEVGRFRTWTQRHPQTQFIVAHLIGLEILAPYASRLQNVAWDISPSWGSTLERVQWAASIFGAERLTLGSDTPFGRDTLRLNIEKVLKLTLSHADKDLILGGNMARLLNLA